MQQFELRSVVTAIGVRLGHKSRAETARYFRVTERTMANWVHRRNYPAEATARQMAQLAGLDVDAFVAYLQAQRATTDDDREQWLRIARRLIVQGGETARIAELETTVSVAGERGSAVAVA